MGSKVIVTPKIIVMGIGGAGCNAVNNMILSGLKGVYFIVANTDAQSLTTSLCENRIQLGASLTSGLGAGSAPEVGKKAAEESLHEIEDYIKDANMLFLAAGMGGGTGTGATPVIAKLAKELGILTVGVVTKPFHFEQKKRLDVADDGLAELDRYCDTLIVISNQKLFGVANEATTFSEAFKMADNVLVSGVKCITNLITNPGIVNLDFADVKSVMSSLGRAIMGEGEASGEKRAIRAAEEAITNPLLEHSSIVGASSILINITSGADITLFEVNDIMQRITAELGNGAVSKFGSVIDTEMEGIIRVSIVATGIKTEDASNVLKFEEKPKQDIKQPSIQNIKPQIRQEFKEPLEEQVINFPIKNQKKEEVIFDDFETEDELVEGNFFIPPAARRVNAKHSNGKETYNTGNGLFSKIFNKKG
jgi:cell division protein FtsZ